MTPSFSFAARRTLQEGQQLVTELIRRWIVFVLIDVDIHSLVTHLLGLPCSMSICPLISRQLNVNRHRPIRSERGSNIKNLGCFPAAFSMVAILPSGSLRSWVVYIPNISNPHSPVRVLHLHFPSPRCASQTGAVHACLSRDLVSVIGPSGSNSPSSNFAFEMLKVDRIIK